MSDIKLFHIRDGSAEELRSDFSGLEKPLQNLVERNLESLLAVRFVSSEYGTGKVHGGRIDTLGLDENACPVIIEYKRSTDENVINQGLFYLDWLMDHQAEFKQLVMGTLGEDAGDKIDWSAPRVICIAGDFNKYDEYAVQQIDRNIELFKYRMFGDSLFLLELVRANSESPSAGRRSTRVTNKSGDKTVEQALSGLSPAMVELFESLETYLNTLGDDVHRKNLKLYVAFKRIKNFASVVVQQNNLLVCVHLDPDSVELVEGFTRDMRGVGHWGTGDLQITLGDQDDLEKAKTLLRAAYEGR